MSTLARSLSRIAHLVRDIRGSMVIETALVAPVLVCLSLGGFEVSRIVARQHDLQAGAADAEQIVLAAASGTATDTTTMKNVLVNTLAIPDQNVDVDKLYRCGTNASLSSTQCTAGSWQSTYVQVTFRDTYTPIWTSFGVSSPINYNVKRLIQVSAGQVPTT